LARMAPAAPLVPRSTTPSTSAGLRRSATALLLIDFINPLDFPGAAKLAAHAVPADCVASETTARKKSALEFMARVLEADTRPSRG
jgi:hypothetical protein